jgi:flavodoxin I
LGASTWGLGEVQDDWVGKEALSGVDLAGKKVAVFGTGDQDGYPDTFVDAIGILANSAQRAGGSLMGQWPTEGYTFDSSEAAKGDSFVGLPLDEDNQTALTDERITKWCQSLKQTING